MSYQERFNSERYIDMTAYLAIRNADRAKAYNKSRSYIRGDIYLADLDPVVGSVQGGTRPVLLLQNNAGNLFCPTLIVAPITSKATKKVTQPTHRILSNLGGLRDDSTVLMEQITTIDKRQIIRYLGSLSSEQMKDVSEAIRISLELDIPEEMEAP